MTNLPAGFAEWLGLDLQGASKERQMSLAEEQEQAARILRRGVADGVKIGVQLRQDIVQRQRGRGDVVGLRVFSHLSRDDRRGPRPKKKR